MKRIAAVILLMGLPWVASARQSGDSDCFVPEGGKEDHALQLFLKAVCEATEPFKDLNRAIAMGYRPIGPETPHMGQHWVNLPLAMRGRFDAARPPVLTYSTLNGGPVLTGVAYLVPYVGPPPEKPPVPGASWHYHAGSLEEELLESSRSHQHETIPDAGAAMFHAWIWSPNPEGLFTADNWSLPYLQEHLAPNAMPDTDVARALFLRQNGASYYEALIDDALESMPDPSRIYPEILESYRLKIDAVLASTESPPSDLEPTLKRLWEEMWVEIADSMTGEQWAAIAPLSR